jgi:cell division septation protein DedD
MLNQTGGSKTDTIVKMALIFFISLFSFSVGTFVGKNVSDSERKKAMLEEDYDKFRGTAAVDPAAMDVEPSKAVTDADVQSLTEEFVNSEKDKQGEGDKATPETEPAHNDNHRVTESGAETGDGYRKIARDGKAPEAKAPEAKAPEAKSAPAVVAKSESSPTPKIAPLAAADRVAAGKSPAKDIPPARMPASKLPMLSADSIGKYTVQLASYPSERDAKDHAQKLRDKGLEAFFVKAQIKGETWYRVSAGLFDDKGEANNYRTKVMADAGVRTAIVQKILPE